MENEEANHTATHIVTKANDQGKMLLALLREVTQIDADSSDAVPRLEGALSKLDNIHDAMQEVVSLNGQCLPIKLQETFNLIHNEIRMVLHGKNEKDDNFQTQNQNTEKSNSPRSLVVNVPSPTKTLLVDTNSTNNNNSKGDELPPRPSTSRRVPRPTPDEMFDYASPVASPANVNKKDITEPSYSVQALSLENGQADETDIESTQSNLAESVNQIKLEFSTLQRQMAATEDPEELERLFKLLEPLHLKSQAIQNRILKSKIALDDAEGNEEEDEEDQNEDEKNEEEEEEEEDEGQLESEGSDNKIQHEIASLLQLYQLLQEKLPSAVDQQEQIKIIMQMKMVSERLEAIKNQLESEAVEIENAAPRTFVDVLRDLEAMKVKFGSLQEEMAAVKEGNVNGRDPNVIMGELQDLRLGFDALHEELNNASMAEDNNIEDRTDNESTGDVVEIPSTHQKKSLFTGTEPEALSRLEVLQNNFLVLKSRLDSATPEEAEDIISQLNDLAEEFGRLEVLLQKFETNEVATMENAAHVHETVTASVDADIADIESIMVQLNDLQSRYTDLQTLITEAKTPEERSVLEGELVQLLQHAKILEKRYTDTMSKARSAIDSANASLPPAPVKVLRSVDEVQNDMIQLQSQFIQIEESIKSANPEDYPPLVAKMKSLIVHSDNLQEEMRVIRKNLNNHIEETQAELIAKEESKSVKIQGGDKQNIGNVPKEEIQLLLQQMQQIQTRFKLLKERLASATEEEIPDIEAELKYLTHQSEVLAIAMQQALKPTSPLLNIPKAPSAISSDTVPILPSASHKNTTADQLKSQIAILASKLISADARTAELIKQELAPLVEALALISEADENSKEIVLVDQLLSEVLALERTHFLLSNQIETAPEADRKVILSQISNVERHLTVVENRLKDAILKAASLNILTPENESLMEATQKATKFCSTLSPSDARSFLYSFLHKFQSPIMNDKIASSLLVESIVFNLLNGGTNEIEVREFNDISTAHKVLDSVLHSTRSNHSVGLFLTQIFAMLKESDDGGNDEKINTISRMLLDKLKDVHKK